MWLKGGQLSLAETLPQKSVWGPKDERRFVATSPAPGPQASGCGGRARAAAGADGRGSGLHRLQALCGGIAPPGAPPPDLVCGHLRAPLHKPDTWPSSVDKRPDAPLQGHTDGAQLCGSGAGPRSGSEGHHSLSPSTHDPVRAPALTQPGAFQQNRGEKGRVPQDGNQRSLKLSFLPPALPQTAPAPAGESRTLP